MAAVASEGYSTSTAVAHGKVETAVVDQSAVVQMMKEWIESLPFPAIANDWQSEEITCIAMNDHYVKDQNCPREFLMNKNNRVLDPTHLTSLPAAVRVGIRAALAYGHQFDTHFETVESAAPGTKFMKKVSIRTVRVAGFRFVVGWQHHMGKDVQYGSRSSGWWKLAEDLVTKKASAVSLPVSWIQEEEASKWQAELNGVFDQTEHLCRKEDLDAAILKALAHKKSPVILCDPFLPECPVIGVNAAAQAMTGWGHVGRQEVASADVRLLAGAKPSERGGYHLTYGRYAEGEEEELQRLAVRAARANGRPCSVKFRKMFELPGDRPLSLWLQGVTVAYGVNKGPLGGGAHIWYLVGILSDAPVDAWEKEAPSSVAMASLKQALQEVLEAHDALPKPGDSQEAGEKDWHPYGGDVRLLSKLVWHCQP